MQFWKPKSNTVTFKDDDGETFERTPRNEAAVYKEIADKYGSRIPIMKHIAKKEDSVPMTIRINSRFAKMIELIAMHSGRFNTRAEVCRSIINLGTMIHYHLFNCQDNARAQQLYNLIQRGEMRRFYEMLIDETMIEAKAFVAAVAQGRETQESFNKWAKVVVSEFPPEMYSFMTACLDNVVNGQSVPEVFGIRKKGRKIDIGFGD